MDMQPMQKREFMSPTNSFENQLALKLNEDAIVLSVIVNSIPDLVVNTNESVIHVFDQSSLQQFLDQFAETKENKLSLGIPILLTTQLPMYMFMFQSEEGIMLFGVVVDYEVVSLFDELVQINNDQMKSIRELYHKLSKLATEEQLLEEIMHVNNELVNTRRELAQKNAQLESLNEELRMMNYTDYLTKAFNRRKFFVDIYSSVQKEEQVLCMIDFNNFKIVNDQFGHKTGDELLVYFVTVIETMIEPHRATLYRLGGDEFAIVGPKSFEQHISSIIPSVNDCIKQYHTDMSLAYGVVPITANTVNKDHPIEESMAKADALMYEKKQAFHAIYDIRKKQLK
jgi:diguanylate cyclase (GGDEF)-like protein